MMVLSNNRHEETRKSTDSVKQPSFLLILLHPNLTEQRRPFHALSKMAEELEKQLCVQEGWSFLHTTV